MKIIYETETGISIIHPTGELSIEEVFNKDVPEKYKSTAKIVEDNIILADRTFRGAWKFDKGKIVEDMDKAKEIHKDKLREERKPLLEKLDVDYMRALEREEETKFIISEKTRLRDITKKVDSCENLDDIKKVKI
jgi:hypothetical protein